MKNCTQFLLTDHHLINKNFVSSKNKIWGNYFYKTFLTLGLLFFIIFSSSIVNAQIQTTHLYLSNPGQAIDRTDPVATSDNSTAPSSWLYQTAPGVTVDATSTGYSNNPGINTFTVSHTTGIGNNRLMLVGISDKNKLVSSVTYGGIALTLVGESVSNGNAHMHIYSLINPASGTANVVVNLNANPDKGIVVGVTTFNNVNQATPMGTFASATAKTTTASVTVTSVTGELVYNVATYRNVTMTVGAGQTALYNINSGGEVDGGGASTKPGAASVTTTWTGAASEDWATGAVSIKPAPLVNSTSFVQSPLCSSITIKAGNTITVTNYLSGITGTMPSNPNITAVLKYNTTTIITLTNPAYNSGTGLLTWTGTLGADVIVPEDEVISLEVTNAQSGTGFNIQFDSQTKPSKITLPLSTSIDLNSFNVYSAAYPAGNILFSGVGSNTRYLRAVVSNAFGYTDITSVNFTITPTGSVFAGTLVASAGCIRTYEYVWAVPASATTYSITAIAKQGYENQLADTGSTSYAVCVLCPPDALNDSASGSGGSPIVVDALVNDYDPNNNINTATLSIVTQPNNGTGYISNGKIVYLPNGSFSGQDTIKYRVCDNTSLCDTARIFFTINASIIDPCSDATRSQVYFLPYPENEVRVALDSSASPALASNNIRTIISLRIPYTGMQITWDHWEDGYETNILNPTQSTTLVWGDGNPFNGIAPGYPNDLITNNGSIVLDNTIPTNPRVSSNIFYDGRDKIYSSGQIAVTQVCGEPSIIGLQCMKTNVCGTSEFGTSFTIPVGQNYNSQDFRYTSLFIRAKENNTVLNIDKDNDGTLETTATINEGEVYHVNGGVMSGAIVTASSPVGCDLHFGGNDNYSSRDVPIYPASWYSHTYYSPVPTTGSGTAIKDTAVVMLYNSLNRSLDINWSSGIPSSGTITIPAKSVLRFPLALSATAAYKFVNPTGESFTAIEIVDSYTPGGGGNSGSTFDWAFNLISEARLTDFTTIAWAPGSTDGTRNDNPIWVTPAGNTTIYVKYNGNIVSGGTASPCGFYYDVSYTLNALDYKRLLDAGDNDQSGLAVFTCNGVKLAAVYGEDPSTANTANPSWDVGSTLQPFCKQKLIFANDDYKTTLVNQPVTIAVLLNDFGFLAAVDPTTLTTIGLLQPNHGTVTTNANGTLLYRPNTGYVGNDTLEYQVCSTPSPVVCDVAQVIIKISACPSNSNNNTLTGQVFDDKNKDGVNNDGGTGLSGGKMYLYLDGNCTGVIDTNELMDSVILDSSGYYQFVRTSEKIVADDFEGTGGTRSCANGTDGNTPWATDWVDANDNSTGYCNTSQSASNTDAEIMKDGSFTFGLRLKDNNVSATRTVNLSGATKAFLTFDYRKKTALAVTEDVAVQASSNGSAFTTIFTITGNATTDASYVTVYNQDITAYASATTYLRFLTNNNVDDADTVYIDNIKIQFLQYSQCYITKFNPGSIPANSYISTAVQKTTTFSNGGTCTSLLDFGIAKSSITVSGTLYNDSNGLVDVLVNGTATGSPGGATVYAYLVDSTGAVAFKTTVNSGTGAYSFPLADVNTNYTLMLSTRDSAVFSKAPSSAAFGATWSSVGDAYGTNNGAGTGIKSGTPVTSIAVHTGLSNATNVNFGIQRLPNSDTYYTSITHPYINQYITLNGGINPPVLSGSDPEDYPGGGVLSTRTVFIDTIPDNAELYYNNTLVTSGQTISNFNASLLQVKVTDASIGDTTISFHYSYIDAASKKDPSPAKYTLVWSWPLPATGLIAQVVLTGTIATIRWSTLSEQNTDYFVLERSLDNNNFTSAGNPVEAAKNSTTKKEYEQPDNISSFISNPVIYYRVKLVDIDGKFKYSNQLALRLSQKTGVTVWPNPFQSSITVSITTEKETIIDINLIDIGGRTIRKTSQAAGKGITKITLSNLEQLAAGVYRVEITDRKSDITYQKLLKNNK